MEPYQLLGATTLTQQEIGATLCKPKPTETSRVPLFIVKFMGTGFSSSFLLIVLAAAALVTDPAPLIIEMTTGGEGLTHPGKSVFNATLC
jgi:hypothetical protein